MNKGKRCIYMYNAKYDKMDEAYKARSGLPCVIVNSFKLNGIQYYCIRWEDGREGFTDEGELTAI